MDKAEEIWNDLKSRYFQGDSLRSYESANGNFVKER